MVKTKRRITITELALLFECSVVTIRAWEDKGITPKPSRTLSNRRVYNEKDVEVIKDAVAQFRSKQRYNFHRKG